MSATGVRFHGPEEISLVLLHGGPGAPGEIAPVAREMGRRMGVLEPYQSKDSVDGQVEELAEAVRINCKEPVCVAGWSWGAWLGWWLAARHPQLVKKLILISSGPFKAHYAAQIMPTRLSRLNEAERARLDEMMSLLSFGAEPHDRKLALSEFIRLLDKADSYQLLKQASEPVEFQMELHRKVWAEAEGLRKNGELLAESRNITCQVTAIHGDYDPHPYKGVKEPLSAALRDFRFILLKDCGHHPWMERKAREVFFEVLTREVMN